MAIADNLVEKKSGRTNIALFAPQALAAAAITDRPVERKRSMDPFDGMRQFLSYHRRMFGLCLAVAVAVTVFLAIFRADDMGWAGGFAIGSLAQLFKFGFIDINVIKKLAIEKKNAASAQLKSMFLSLALFGLAVLFVYKLKMNVWAMAAGIFLPRLILVADTYIRPNPFKDASEK